jgi:2-polyprenyl-6-methoxyphenol hydroxylase-like FAD-dependent oxidoreductase
MPRRQEADAEVAIVGYGPVGSTLAILLAQRGRSVVVLERWPQPYPLPRAVHMDHEVARILQSCGIGEQLRAIGEPAHVYEWRNGAGVVLLRFGRPGASVSGWPESLMFTQPELEDVLDQRARSLPLISVRRGTEVTGLGHDGSGMVLRTADGTEIRARYVVGCDGANSTIRALAGLPVQDLGFFFDWLIVDVVLAQPRVFDPVNVQVCDPARPTTDGGSSCACRTRAAASSARRRRRGNCSRPGTSTPAMPGSSGTPCTPSAPVTPNAGGAAPSCSRVTPRT